MHRAKTSFKIKIKVDGHAVEVDIERLAKAISVNYADWPASKGRAEKIARELSRVVKIEKDLFLSTERG